MMDTVPFFYVVRHVDSGVRYAGIRVAKGCHPKQLGVTYFTSSNIVGKKWRGGEIFEIDRIRLFSTGVEAAHWEGRFLSRINAADSPMWFNRCHGGTSAMMSYLQSEAGKKEVEMLRKEYWSNPENRKKQSNRRKEFYQLHPDAKEQHIERMRVFYSNNANRENAAEKTRQAFARPEARKIASIAKGGREFLCVETGQVFHSQASAAQAFGLCRESIRDVLKGRRGSSMAGGYSFRYVTGDDRQVVTKEEAAQRKAIKISASRGGFPVVCLETGGKYPTMGSAAKALNVYVAHISEFFSGKRKSANGYTFVRAD